jgi:hypothetical protein
MLERAATFDGKEIYSDEAPLLAGTASKKINECMNEILIVYLKI